MSLKLLKTGEEDLVVAGRRIWSSSCGVTLRDELSDLGTPGLQSGSAATFLSLGAASGRHRGSRWLSGHDSRCEIQNVVRVRHEHGWRQIDVPEEIGCVGPVLMHGASKCTADNKR